MSATSNCLLAAGLALACSMTVGAEPQSGADRLPLERVALFTSGVGFFQHTGKVTDDAMVEMKFPAADVNDLLKSMVLEDLDGGSVSTVSYASRDPITKTLGTFAVNLTDNPSLGQIIGRLRGEKVELDAANRMAGTIVGVERRTVPAGEKQTVEKEFLTLLTAGGLRTLALDAITEIRLVDKRLQGELEKALAVLALGHDNDKKSVVLQFTGKGQRNVRVGYVQESPLWKTSYRLVLDEPAAGEQRTKARLQGWAIVENTTDQDWKDVRMSLVSGRPISFTMDLYQPLYVPRPRVVPELYASLLPQVYGQDLVDAEREFGRAEGKGRPAESPLAAKASRIAGGGGGGKEADKGAAKQENETSDTRRRAQQAKDMFSAAESIRSLAAGENLGELFRYEIERPVTIDRQRSAMLPIVAEGVEVEKVAIYDERVLAKHPLAGLRLVNSTKLNLMQGPLTVFEAGGYAGDSRVEDMAPGSERLLSYAIDLDVEVNPRTQSQADEMLAVKIVKGTLVVTRKATRKKVFEIKNSGSKPVKMLVEHPRDGGNWKLVAPEKTAETTRDRYRFAVLAEPGKPATLEVVEEQPGEQRIALSNIDAGQIGIFVQSKVPSQRVKDALGQVLAKKRGIEEIVRTKQEKEREIQVVEQEQNRLRQNMGNLDRNNELYLKYVRKMTEQEDRVDVLRKEITVLIQKEQAARRELDDFLQQLELD
ncbi:hypothetical protein LBMAG47_08380 [Planctomycetia bacterium]|nr:hypothetical protein LBMAG47_08380 [Planctomycetia bacterium]